jgi:transmembrane sensor
MSGGPHPPANSDVARGGAYWALRQEEGPALSPAEQAELSAWLAADPANRADLQAMRDVLTDTALTAAMTRFVTADVVPVQPTRRAWMAGGIAAALSLTIGAPLLLSRRREEGAVSMARVTVPPGAARTIALADGSQVIANGRTDLLTAADTPSRQLMLTRGEAFIRVAAMAEPVPFAIDCGAARIQTLAGALNLDVADGLTEISLYEGAALVTVGDRAVRLRPGERAGVEGTRVTGPVAFDPQAGDFRTGWLVTQGLSLSQLTERLNRTAPVPVRIADPAIGGRRVAGRFKLTEPDRLLSSLGKLHGFTVRRRDGALELVTA